MQDKDKIDSKFFLAPYKGLIAKQGAEKLQVAKKRRRMDYKAYLITTKLMPEFYFLCFVTYEDARAKADEISAKYLTHGYEKVALAECSSYLGDYLGLRDTSNGIYFSLKRKRANNVDKYFYEKKAPVYELMELGIKFRCKNCGKGMFGLEEYNDKKCFILEGEGEYNYFTKGVVFCRNCYNEYYL